VAEVTLISTFANLVTWPTPSNTYQRVLDEVESWPVGILADYTRLVELLMEFGPVLKMPHSRPQGGLRWLELNTSRLLMTMTLF
jgi:hypothetical protein